LIARLRDTPPPRPGLLPLLVRAIESIAARIDSRPAAVLSLYAPALSTCMCFSKPPIRRSSRIITSSVRDSMTRSVAQRRMYSLVVKQAASA